MSNLLIVVFVVITCIQICGMQHLEILVLALKNGQKGTLCLQYQCKLSDGNSVVYMPKYILYSCTCTLSMGAYLTLSVWAEKLMNAINIKFFLLPLLIV